MTVLVRLSATSRSVFDIRRVDRLVAWCTERHQRLALAFAFAGFFLIIVSAFLHIEFVEFAGVVKGPHKVVFDVASRQVGYAFAPNWGLTTTVLLPLALFYLLRARDMIPSTLRSLVGHKMYLRALDARPAVLTPIQKAFDQECAKWQGFAVLAGFLTFAAIAWLYYDTVLVRNILDALGTNPIEGTMPTIQSASQTFDWTIASRLQGETATREQVSVFGALAYGLLAIELSLGVYLLVWLLSLQALIRPETQGGIQYVLVPDKKSQSTRRGFAEIDRVLMSILFGLFLLTLVVVFVHLAHIYLRSPNFTDPWVMIFDGAGFVLKLGELKVQDVPMALIGAMLGSKGLAVHTVVSFSLALLIGFLAAVSILIAVTGWNLYEQAGAGARYLMGRRPNDTKLAENLAGMNNIPGGRVALVLLAAMGLLLLGAAIWFNFIGLVIGLSAIVIVYAVRDYFTELLS